jgi:hypothetical protein
MSKNKRWWSLEMSIVAGEMHERLTMFSGVVVKTRSRILFNLVGHVLIWCKKKSKVSSLNSADPAEVLLSGE